MKELSEEEKEASVRVQMAEIFRAISGLEGLPVPYGLAKKLDEVARDVRIEYELEREDSSHTSINDLVRRFSEALRLKLIVAEEKYDWDNGWTDNDWADDLRKDIRRHLEKGDPRDVAAYCAFAWHHGWSLTLVREREK